MKTNEEYKEELRCRDITAQERVVSDERYAIKLVEKIVFGFLLMILTSFGGYIIKLVIK